jgi:hypothetical protein
VARQGRAAHADARPQGQQEHGEKAGRRDPTAEQGPQGVVLGGLVVAQEHEADPHRRHERQKHGATLHRPIGDADGSAAGGAARRAVL